MEKLCIKCGYQRKPGDTAPEGECPHCGAIYAKGEEKTTTTSTSDDDEIDTKYYENSEIKFCESVTSTGDVEGEATSFHADRNGSREVTIYISNDKAFKTTKMYIDVYDKNDKKVDDFNVDAQEEWDWIKFKETFTALGEYTIDIYNADNIFINSATVTITR